MARMRGWGLFTALCWLLATAPGARACAIDGVPSLRADGVAAVLNRVQPTSATISQWAPFVFPRAFSRGQPVILSEDLRELARTLPPEIVHGRWLWRPGDGARLYGQTVSHRFSHPGTYRITVAVLLPSTHVAYLFDAALLRVR